MAGRFSVEAVFKAIDRVSAPITKMQNRVGKFTRKMSRGLRTLNRQVDGFGRSLKKASVIGAASLLIAGSAMADVIKTGAEFEQTLVSAAAKFPEGIRRGSQAFKDLEDIARKTGATTEFTAAQAASGLNFLAMAGFNAEQSISALPAIVDLATAAQIDLGTASDIATDSLGAFGLATKDAVQQGKNLNRINDVLAKTATTANTSIEAMFEAVVKGAPDFTKGGQSLETFSAFIGVMANSGKKGAEAGTALRNMMLRLSDPAKSAQKVLDKLGIKVADGNGNFRDAIDILADFEKSTKKMGNVQRTAALSTVFGTRAVGSINILLSEGTEKLRAYRKQLEGAGGAASEMAGVMRDTLQGRINSMTSAIEGLKITIFSLKNQAIAGAVEGITEFVRTIDTAINSNKALAAELIDGLMQAGKGVIGIFGILIAKFIIVKGLLITMAVMTKAWTVAIFALNAILGIFNAIMAVAKVVMWAMNIAMSANPIGAIILAVAALIGLGVLLIKNWDSIVEAVTSAVAKIKPLIDFLARPFKDLIGGLSTVFGAVKGLFGGDEEEKKAAGLAPAPQVITPQDRIAQTIEERRETSTAELTITDNTGRAELTQKGRGTGVNLKLAESGAF